MSRVKYRDGYLKTLRGTIYTLLAVAVIAVLVATIWLPVLQIYEKSMTPMLEAGDLVVSVNDNQLESGDVIAFYYNNKVLVKRVIATSGQWVDIDEDGNVSVDGEIIDEPCLSDGEKSYGDTNIELPYQVPDGKYFVMGDHRSVSRDSRSEDVGQINEDDIMGKAFIRIYPFNEFGLI